MKKLVLLVSAALLLVLFPLMPGQAAEVLDGSKRAEVIDLNEIPDWVDEVRLETAGEDSAGARMKYLVTVGAEIHITPEGVATVYADAISASSQLTNLLVVAELQQLVNGEWTTLRTYRYFTGDTSAAISETCNVARGYYYRTVNTTTAYAGSDSETKVVESPSWNFYVPGT